MQYTRHACVLVLRIVNITATPLRLEFSFRYQQRIIIPTADYDGRLELIRKNAGMVYVVENITLK